VSGWKVRIRARLPDGWIRVESPCPHRCTHSYWKEKVSILLDYEMRMAVRSTDPSTLTSPHYAFHLPYVHSSLSVTSHWKAYDCDCRIHVHPSRLVCVFIIDSTVCIRDHSPPSCSHSMWRETASMSWVMMNAPCGTIRHSRTYTFQICIPSMHSRDCHRTYAC